MKLLLTSAGITNNSIEQALAKLLGKPYNKSHLTFIPTAANGETGDKSWLINDLQRFNQLGLKSLDIVDIAAVPKSVWQAALKQSDIIVMGGGNVGYLMEELKKSQLDKQLLSLLKTKVYVGISAGSMVAAKQISLSSASILYYEESGKLKILEGLNFVSFELWPHLNSEWFPKVRLPYLESLKPQVPAPFYAVDDDTAVQVVDGEVSVISEGEWKKFE